MNYFITNSDIDSLESKSIKDSKLQHLNTMVHNNYISVEYTIIDFDSFTENFGEETPEVDLLFDDYNQNLPFFYVKVKDSSERIYNSLEMGRGEYLSIVYFILFYFQRK